MSKGSKSKTTRFNTPTQRTIFHSANRRLLGGTTRTPRQMLLDISRLTGQDKRAYNPTIRNTKTKNIPSRLITGGVNYAPTRIQKNTPLMKAQMQFVLPKETTTCVRRGIRKEVLFAKKLTGRGSRARNRKFTSNSKVKC